MKKYAALFPGQGSQYVGMGKNLFDAFPAARRVFDDADRILEFSLSNLCFNGPEAELILTQNSQPAIYTVSIAAYAVLQEQKTGFHPSATAGLSLGEFSALTAAGVLPFEQGISLVRDRGRFMQEAAQRHPGKMASILGLDRQTVTAICQELGKTYRIGVANINSPTQIVISGESRGIEQGMVLAKEKGARKCIELKVSGAFHSPLMSEARERLASRISTLALHEPQIPVVFNATGTVLNRVQEIKQAMISQVTSPVLWTDIMHVMVNMYQLKTFVEIGCGTVLKGLVRGIDPEAVTYNVSDRDNLEKTIEELNK